MPPKRRKAKSTAARTRKTGPKKQKTKPNKSGSKSAQGPVRRRPSTAKERSARSMSVAVDQQLGADQVAQILADCVPRAGGNSNEIVLTKALQSYGFHFQNQVDTLTSFIIGDANFGVGRYGFHLSGDALNFAAPGTTLSDLADAVQNKATP
jgi:hypothetical protein